MSLSAISSFSRKIFGVEEVLDPDAVAGELVHVGRADAALGGPDLLAAEEPLHHGVELAVVRHDQVGVAGDADPGRVDAPCRERRHLLEQDRGVDDAPVADHRGDLAGRGRRSG